jgi:hypothetical protein
MDCPAGCNAYLNNCKFACCGDDLYYSPFDTFCFGLCENKHCWATNFCSMMGKKTGEPCFTTTILSHIMPGSGEQLTQTLHSARAAYVARTQKQAM